MSGVSRSEPRRALAESPPTAQAQARLGTAFPGAVGGFTVNAQGV